MQSLSFIAETDIITSVAQASNYRSSKTMGRGQVVRHRLSERARASRIDVSHRDQDCRQTLKCRKPFNNSGTWPSGKAPGFGPGIRRFESCRPSHETRSASAGLFSCMRLLDLVLRISSNAGYIRMFGVAKSRAEVHFEHDCAKKRSAILPSQQGSAIFEYISKTGSYDPVLSVTSSF